MQFLVAVILVVISVTYAVPHHKYSKSDKQHVYYDQKQEGEVNVRADLKDFVILVIPTGKQQQEPSNPASLLDFLMKSQQHQNKRHLKPTKQEVKGQEHENEVGRETMTFLEAKTAPYHVDISKSTSHLMNDEIKATQTPPKSLTMPKGGEDMSKIRSRRFTEALILTVPEEDFVLTKSDDMKNELTTDTIKEMTLLGAIEQCGPEMYRDDSGLCKLRNSI